MAPARIKFLTGAPTLDALDWSDQNLLTSFTPHTLRFLSSGSHQPVEPSLPDSNWRVIPLNNQSFCASPSLTSAARKTKRPIDGHHQDFLDHSFAVLADLQSSQLAPQLSGQFDEESTFITESSVLSTAPDDSTFLTGEVSIIPTTYSPTLRQARRFAGPVLSIQAIPNADYLNHLQPQTMTVNLIVGVISSPTVRTVKVRRGNYDMEIIEFLVGDDTKAGFSISSWHTPPESQQKGEDVLRKTLLALRPCDIILVERLALCSFRALVFGQCLNKRFTKSLTVLSTLVRVREDRNSSPDRDQYPGLSPGVLSKVKRVKDWVTSFIGPTGMPRAVLPPKVLDSTETSRHEDEYLPPDSQ